MISARFFRTAKTIFSSPLHPVINSLQYRSIVYPATYTQKNVLIFFNNTKKHIPSLNVPAIMELFKDITSLQLWLHDIDPSIKENYACNHLMIWLSNYANTSTNKIVSYLQTDIDLNDLCHDFISYCFDNGISLDKNDALFSLSQHNQLSDEAIKEEFSKIIFKETINLFGYGLDEGQYEEAIAKYLIASGKAKYVDIYGYDPYAKRNPNIRYLSLSQLTRKDHFKFDIIVARWVLHHVELEKRWHTLIDSINNANPGAKILIVEHGFVKELSLILEKRLYQLINAFLDVIVNIALRPRYFTDSKILGSNFYIKYLEKNDLTHIQSNFSSLTNEIYDVGPAYANQTICCMNKGF